MFTRVLHTAFRGGYKIVPSMQNMFAKELTHAGHVRRFTIKEEGADGWEVRVEQDSTVLRRVCYTDWHRVERAVVSLNMEVSDLEDGGWVVRSGR